MRVAFVTWGCDKNTVDSEYLAGLLEDRGCEIVLAENATDRDPDAVVIMTCGFIGDAKAQSVEAIVAWADRKRQMQQPRRLFVAGCLSQRYADDLLAEVPEIDGIVGVGQFERLADMIVSGGSGKAVDPVPKVDIYRFLRRRRLDDKPYTFLKIADGCNHACTFCSIPLMKGRLRSVPRAILLEEARELLEQGVKELNLVAQDISVYGTDRGDDYALPELLRDLCAIDGDFWIRCLYCYPGGVTDALIEVMAAEPKIVPYLDIPLQHFDPEILRRMKRPSRETDAAKLVARLRAALPNLTLRTAVIVGFPGETPRAHRRTLEAIRSLSFERLGAFQFSSEEDTPAAREPRPVSKATKEKRWRAVMELQAEISARINQSRVGARTRVLIESFDERRSLWVGRSPAEAPEVDGAVFVEAGTPLAPGRFVTVAIARADVYDVFGTAIDA